MKPKTSIIVFIIYFIIINTQYYWEQNIGFIVIVFATINFILFISFLFLVVSHLFSLFKKEKRTPIRIISIIIGTLVLLTTYLKPYGIIPFEKFEPSPLLTASNTGGGNCNTQLKLYENNKFVEKQRCFSISTTKGNWKLVNDTIYFSNVRIGIGLKEYYKFSILRNSSSTKSRHRIIRYKDNTDSIGNSLWITKNELMTK